MRALARVNWLGLLTALLLLALWEALVRYHILDYQFLVAPSAVAAGAARLLRDGELGTNVLHTMRATMLGWAAAATIGIGLGLLLGLSTTAWRSTIATIEAIRAIPPMTMVPVALLVFGFSIWMELAIIVYASAWPILINTMEGVRGVRPELLDLARVLRLSRLETVRKVILPAAMPLTLVGLRLALSYALTLAVVAEMAGNPSGLGNALVSAQQALRPDEMFAYLMTIGLLGVALNAVFRYLTSRALPALASTQETTPQ